MVAAIRVHKTGGPEVLAYEEITLPPPGPGEIRIVHRAIGVNYIDTYLRGGLYPVQNFPFVAGNEGAGDVAAVGSGVTDIKVGDRVAYYHSLGGYAQERNLPADRAVKIPDGISYEQAAGMMLKGMTAQSLLRSVFKVGKDTT
ncbi:MAG: alcohol dehydrogenase catalytic domain-containing protein, partial [Pseudorhodoplanes sp.]